MNAEREIKIIKMWIEEAEVQLDLGDRHVAESWIYALQVFLNRCHHPPHFWSSASLQSCSKN